MKTHLYRQYWLTICSIIALVLILTVSFTFMLKNEKGDTSSYAEALGMIDAQEDMSAIGFAGTLWDLITTNMEAKTEQGMTNVCVYGICELLICFALIEVIIWGVGNLLVSITITVSKKQREKDAKTKLQLPALFAPLLLWAGTLLFSWYYSSFFPESANIKVYTEYTRGVPFLYAFIGIMALYWIGYYIIGRVVKE